MINQLKFVFGWVKKNKSMSIVYLIIMGMIACSTILLMQFFYEQSTYDQDDVFYDCFYFDESIDYKTVDNIVRDLQKMDISVLELEVGAKCSDFNGYNEYTFGAYYLFDEVRQSIRNHNYDYGTFENKEGTLIGEKIDAPIEIQGKKLEVEGQGSIIIGSSWCDYLISTRDYEQYIGKIDVIEFTLDEKNNQVSKVISSYINQFTEEKSSGFLSSGFDSIKNTLIVSIILILFSIYSALSFVEIMIHLQKKDIAVMYQCGASPKVIKHLYVSEILLAGEGSFLIGGLLAWIFVEVFDFNFNKISFLVYGISFLLYNICYYVEAVVCIKSAINYVGMISRELD